MLAERHRWWPSITSALGQCIVLSGVPCAGILMVTSIIQQSEKTLRASVEDCGSTLKQYWLNDTCLCKVYNRPGDRLVLGQRQRRLTSIEPGSNGLHRWY